VGEGEDQPVRPKDFFEWYRAYFKHEGCVEVDGGGAKRGMRLRDTFGTMAVLLTFTDSQTLKCWPSHEAIARSAGVSAKTVARHLAANIRAGWLEKTREGRNVSATTTNEYRLRYPPRMGGGPVTSKQSNRPAEGGMPTPPTAYVPPVGGATPHVGGVLPPTGEHLTTHSSSQGTAQKGSSLGREVKNYGSEDSHGTALEGGSEGADDPALSSCGEAFGLVADAAPQGSCSPAEQPAHGIPPTDGRYAGAPADDDAEAERHPSGRGGCRWTRSGRITDHDPWASGGAADFKRWGEPEEPERPVESEPERLHADTAERADGDEEEAAVDALGPSRADEPERGCLLTAEERAQIEEEVYAEMERERQDEERRRWEDEELMRQMGAI
jgi:hypothetical protein